MHSMQSWRAAKATKMLLEDELHFVWSCPRIQANLKLQKQEIEGETRYQSRVQTYGKPKWIRCKRGQKLRQGSRPCRSSISEEPIKSGGSRHPSQSFEVQRSSLSAIEIGYQIQFTQRCVA